MQTKYKVVLLILIFGYRPMIFSQNEFSKWYFGTQAGLDFATNPPTVLTNGVLNTPEGVATICDNFGNLLFYSDGGAIVNSNHVAMANGAGLFGNGSSTQSGTIVKQPGNANIYFVFTVDQLGAPNGVRYSIVDMTLAAGLGSVTVKNAALYTPSCEKLVAVRHCNGKDVWIITHDYNSNQFRVFLLNLTGVVMPPVISAIGEILNGAGITTAGHLKISPDGKKLAMAIAGSSIPSSFGTGGFHLFNFDASSGVVSNSLVLLSSTNLTQGAYGLEFSPDGTKLYGTTSPVSGTASCTLFQWNVCATNSAAIISSQYSINIGGAGLGSAQRAVDGKIYIATNGSQSLHVIASPNSSGVSMNLILNSQSLGNKLSRLGLPNYINSYAKYVPLTFSSTVACQTASFAVPPIPTFSSGCSSTPYSPNSYLWNFGEPVVGITNTSTLTNPVHTYSNTGTYTVNLILYSNCTNDTLKKVITITTQGPALSVSGASLICKGTKTTYTATGSNTYLWSNNLTTSTVALTPTATTIYSITGTTNGCSVSKQFTLTVNPCTGIKSEQNDSEIKFYPNPVKNTLTIETSKPTHICLFDLTGKVVFETDCIIGNNEIDTSKIDSGIYNLEQRGAFGIQNIRLIKME